MEAQVWMTGRVGGDVDVRESASSPWSTFRMACTPRVVRGGEWGDEQTTWVTVSCSHRLAEHVRLSLRKGDPVIVVGKLRTRRWFDANGVEHEQLQIRASSVGHDLSIGTSSFYRPRRDGTGEVAAGDAGPVDADEATPEEVDPDDVSSGVAPWDAAVVADPAAAEREPAEPDPSGPDLAVAGVADPADAGVDAGQAQSREGRRRRSAA